MANRPVFKAAQSGNPCQRVDVEFTYYSGFSVQQNRRSIQSLHDSYRIRYPDDKLLEVSSKSENPLGVSLSAFNLMLTDSEGRKASVEMFYQAGKVFLNGGPYLDLLIGSSREAKKDERLKNSGPIVGFWYDGASFANEPTSLFYNWLYCNALWQNPALAAALVEYDAFTDIAFNPKKSLNCQAEAAAVYVSLHRQGLLEEALASRESFLRLVYPAWKK